MKLFPAEVPIVSSSSATAGFFFKWFSSLYHALAFHTHAKNNEKVKDYWSRVFFFYSTGHYLKIVQDYIAAPFYTHTWNHKWPIFLQDTLRFKSSHHFSLKAASSWRLSAHAPLVNSCAEKLMSVRFISPSRSYSPFNTTSSHKIQQGCVERGARIGSLTRCREFKHTASVNMRKWTRVWRALCRRTRLFPLKELCGVDHVY